MNGSPAAKRERICGVLLLLMTLAAKSGHAVPSRRVMLSSWDSAPVVTCDSGDSDCGDPASAPFVFSVRHSYSHLPGSSFHPRSGEDKHVVTPEHAAIWRKHDVIRYRRHLAELSRESLAGEPGAFFKLGGNAEPTIAGLYWTEIGLGQPAQNFRLQIDTGSGIVWVTCNPCYSCPASSVVSPLSPPFDATLSATTSPIDCDKPLCSDMQQTQSTLGMGCLGTDSNNRKCYYGIAYGDGSTTEGYLLQDQLHYTALDGTNMQMPFTFGCGYNQTGNLITGGQLVDGVMGLGRNPLSLSTQLMTARMSSQVFSHCLGGEAEGGGTLVMGSVEEDGMSYTPMDSTRSAHYFVTLNGISVDSDLVPGITASSFGGINGATGVIFDSGTTLALLPFDVYSLWLQTVQSKVSGLNQLQVQEYICYDFSSQPYTDLDKYFPSLTLHFDGADMKLGPSGYLFLQSFSNGGKAACIGWQALSQQSTRVSVIGDIVLRNHLIVYDLQNNVIGFGPFDCSSGTLKASNGDYNVTIVIGAQSSPSTSLLLGLSRDVYYYTCLAVLVAWTLLR